METLTTLDKAIRLQKVELFGDMETDVLALAASIAGQIHCPDGTVLLRENGPSEALYVVLDGRVRLSRGNREIFSVGPGEALGNWALFDDQPSVVTATCSEDAWLLKIEREDFFDLLADHTEMTQRMFKALARRVRTVLARGLTTEQVAQQSGTHG